MAASSSNSLDVAAFWERTKRVYQSWRDSKEDWNGIETIVLTFGEADEDVAYTKTTALQIWFFGYEFTQTVMVFCKDQLYILTGTAKVKMLQAAVSYEGGQVVPLKLLTVSKEDLASPDSSENFKALISAIKDQGKTIGILAKEKVIGTLGNAWKKQLDQFESKDATVNFSNVLAVKDEKEVRNVKAAGIFAFHVIKKLISGHIEKFIDAGDAVSHSSLADEAEKFFNDPTSISAKLDAKVIDSCYTPMVQSGGKFNVKPGSPNNDDNLHAGTIILSLGARFKYYCSNLARTLFVNPTDEHRAAYDLLIDTQAAILKVLRPGTPLNHVYKTALNFVESKRADLAPKFGKSCGFGIGLEFQETNFILNARNENIIRENMIFNLSLSFSDLETNSSDPKDKIYSVLLSDTVLVKGADEEPQVLTDKAQKKYEYELETENDKKDVVMKDAKDASMPRPKKDMVERKIKEESGGSESKREVKKERGEVVAGGLTRSALTKDEILKMPRFRDSTADKMEEKEKLKKNEEKRKKHQQSLEEKQLEEAKKRFTKSGPMKTEESKSAGPVAIAYKSTLDLPKDIPKNKLYVDAQRECILAPIYGYLVPFHVSTIKNASRTDEHSLRINFTVPEKFSKNVPKSENNKEEEDSMPEVQLCIKEFTYRCPDEKNLNHCIRMIKELQKRIKERQTSREVTADLSTQEKLVLSKGRNPRLMDTFVRPSATGRKSVGMLEAHTNGFRFTANKGESIDIIYKNIKHAFYQPAEKDVIVLIHFNLHLPIMVGKKKTQDIQFCTEVMEASQSLDSRGKYDPDEIEDEQRERANRLRLNNEYQTFVRKVEEFVPNNALEFDMPYKDLSFYGVPSRSSVLLTPTVNCLVHLSTLPVFVLRLGDVEIAYFERVQFSLKNFDLVFIFKDYAKPVTHINNIPMDSLDTIKDWLNSADILYYEGTQSLNWANIMKTIQADPKKFHTEDGGWKFLSPDSGDEASDSEPESDFAPSGDDDDASGGDDDDDEDDYGSGGDNSDDAFSGEDSEEEEGVDWDELEERAMADDKRNAEKRGRFSDDEGSGDDRPKKKAKPSASSSKGSSSSSKPSSKPSPTSSKPASKPASKPSSAAAKPSSGSSKPTVPGKPASSSSKPGFKPPAQSSSKPSSSKPPVKK